MIDASSHEFEVGRDEDGEIDHVKCNFSQATLSLVPSSGPMAKRMYSSRALRSELMETRRQCWVLHTAVRGRSRAVPPLSPLPTRAHRTAPSLPHTRYLIVGKYEWLIPLDPLCTFVYHCKGDPPLPTPSTPPETEKRVGSHQCFLSFVHVLYCMQPKGCGTSTSSSGVRTKSSIQRRSSRVGVWQGSLSH